MGTVIAHSVDAGSYGAFELKRFYQRHMAIGVLLAAGIHLSLVSGILFYQHWRTQTLDEAGIPVVIYDDPTDLAPPPPMTSVPPHIVVAEPDLLPPSIGIPVPVDDAKVVEEVRFATRDELARLAVPDPTHPGNAAGDSVIVNIPVENYYPQPGQFVAVEEDPVRIKPVEPEYPPIARLTGTEGTVWVQVLVDTDGTVRDARIARSSGSNVGFDEAALEAAYQMLYKPAIQNGKPVPVWVTFPIRFMLNDR